jgi:hypothetical protein
MKLIHFHAKLIKKTCSESRIPTNKRNLFAQKMIGIRDWGLGIGV